MNLLVKNDIEDNIWLDKINKIVNTKLKSNTKYSNNLLISKIKTYLKMLGYQDYLINIALENINLDTSKEDEKLEKDYLKLFNKYKNKYEKNNLRFTLSCNGFYLFCRLLCQKLSQKKEKEYKKTNLQLG